MWNIYFMILLQDIKLSVVRGPRPALVWPRQLLPHSEALFGLSYLDNPCFVSPKSNLLCFFTNSYLLSFGDIREDGSLIFIVPFVLSYHFSGCAAHFVHLAAFALTGFEVFFLGQESAPLHMFWVYRADMQFDLKHCVVWKFALGDSSGCYSIRITITDRPAGLHPAVKVCQQLCQPKKDPLGKLIYCASCTHTHPQTYTLKPQFVVSPYTERHCSAHFDHPLWKIACVIRVSVCVPAPLWVL